MKEDRSGTGCILRYIFTMLIIATPLLYITNPTKSSTEQKLYECKFSNMTFTGYISNENLEPVRVCKEGDTFRGPCVHVGSDYFIHNCK